MTSLTEDNSILSYELLAAYSDIFCFTTTRQGGFSTDAYASFNCSPFCGDKVDNVFRNQEKLCSALPQRPRQLIIPFQTHNTEVRIIDKAFVSASSQEQDKLLTGIDALITCEPGYCLCISTADCVPLLLYDARNKVIAAVHAGWRGTVNRIVQHTLNVMKQAFGTCGNDVSACIGPSISLQSFEVGEEVYRTFDWAGFDMQRISLWNEVERKYHIDLPEANRLQLVSFDVPDKQIEVAGICTYIRHDEFFSARRLGIKSGRILSGIMLCATKLCGEKAVTV
ncbi:Laccase domain protein YfiH [termite gut metagenome]|uniref:Laccase domain protein YfiH n=1 Tax=termite gut metagenome TaxID=433724 RepID=A0A5J4R146_9ZZZZ